MTFGSLFSGIGGMDLGLERAGMECRWQVEIDPFCRRVLEKHWPNVRRYGDIREVDGRELERVDLVCGGFPCQDISAAGRRRGIDGPRSSLWREMFRLVCALRPRYVIVENSPELIRGDIARILGDLASIGMDAIWSVLPACAVGAPHVRKRLFAVAYPAGQWWQQCGWEQQPASGDQAGDLRYWASEPEPPRVADGVSDRMERNRVLGNAVVPQVAEWIGRRILEAQTGALTHD